MSVNHSIRPVPFLWACLFLTAPAFAALTRSAAAQSASKRKATARAANVQAGTISSLDSAAGTVTLRVQQGAIVTYRITDKTLLLRDKKPVEASAFKLADAVVVRFRRSTAGPANLYDLADRASWEWIDRLRHATTRVTVVEMSEDSLRATEGADRAEVTYRVTEKTAFSRAGKGAAAADFKPGEAVYVVPRVLPGGGLLALAVADSAEAAAQLKEMSRATVSGVVRSISVEKHVIDFHTAAGADREVTLAPDCTVHSGSKDVALTALRAGQSVTVHISRNEEGQSVVTQITLKSKRSGAKRRVTSSGTSKPK